MAVNLSPLLQWQILDGNGNPRSGGKIETYLALSSTPAITYKDENGTVQQTNPIILNTLGKAVSPIYLTAGIAYKFVLKDSLDIVIDTYPYIVGINDVSSSVDQYQVFSQTPTYVSPTQFTLAGDQTSTFTVGRVLKLSVTAGIVYATITAAVFGSLTTVTIAGAALDAGLSSVSLSILTPVNPSAPTIPIATVIASAATIDLRGIKSRYVHISGTVATSSILLLNGQEITLIADAAWPLTYHATTNNITTGASTTLAANDIVEYRFGGNVVRGAITKASGVPLVLQQIIQIQPITATAAAGALTITLLPTSLDYRSATLTSGAITTVTNAASLSTVISSGSTAGGTSGVPLRVIVLALNNAGVTALGWTNLAGGLNLDETGVVTTVAEGGAGAADSANVIYSTSALTGVTYRIVGLVDVTNATAGTWLPPTLVQGAGAQALQQINKIITTPSVATTSGTSVDFTGIPSWVKRISIMLAGVSTNGISNLMVQIGDSGGIEVTGYLGAENTSTGATSAQNSTGFNIKSGGVAASIAHGIVTLDLFESATNTWAQVGNIALSNTTQVGVSGGSKALSAQLDRVRLTTAAGTDTFDAGAVSLLLE